MTDIRAERQALRIGYGWMGEEGLVPGRAQAVAGAVKLPRTVKTRVIGVAIATDSQNKLTLSLLLAAS
jgi:hypothetical protein